MIGVLIAGCLFFLGCIVVALGFIYDEVKLIRELKEKEYANSIAL